MKMLIYHAYPVFLHQEPVTSSKKFGAVPGSLLCTEDPVIDSKKVCILCIACFLHDTPSWPHFSSLSKQFNAETLEYRKEKTYYTYLAEVVYPQQF